MLIRTFLSRYVPLACVAMVLAGCERLEPQLESEVRVQAVGHARIDGGEVRPTTLTVHRLANGELRATALDSGWVGAMEISDTAGGLEVIDESARGVEVQKSSSGTWKGQGIEGKTTGTRWVRYSAGAVETGQAGKISVSWTDATGRKCEFKGQTASDPRTAVVGTAFKGRLALRGLGPFPADLNIMLESGMGAWIVAAPSGKFQESFRFQPLGDLRVLKSHFSVMSRSESLVVADERFEAEVDAPQVRWRKQLAHVQGILGYRARVNIGLDWVVVEADRQASLMITTGELRSGGDLGQFEAESDRTEVRIPW